MNQKLNILLSEHLALVIEGEKVKCKLSGHEMPPTFAAVSQYIQGSKYKRLKEINDEFEKNKEYLEDSGGRFYCQLTHKHISKDAAAIRRHVNGNRFKKYLEKAKTNPPTNIEADEVMSDGASSGGEENLIDDGELSDEENFSGESEDENVLHEYPELLNSGLSGSEGEMDAMDTEIDQKPANKRSATKRTIKDSPQQKRKRQ